jgi:phenylalanine-4-hydroxylase
MPFDPFRASVQPYPITSYQPNYFLAESFKDAKEKMRYNIFSLDNIEILLISYSRQYAMTIPRPFTVHYNPYTQTIEVLDGKEQIVNIVRTLRSTKIIISFFYY